jgi:uncharacterized membrane protein YkoI
MLSFRVGRDPVSPADNNTTIVMAFIRAVGGTMKSQTANDRGSWLTLKTGLAASVILLALLAGSLGAAAKSSESQHAKDAQTFELEETIGRELELFRSARVSLQQALLIAEGLHTGSRVVDISFDGASNPPVYRVKIFQQNQIWANAIDAMTGSSTGSKQALSVNDLGAQDRRNLLALRAVRQKLSDAVVVAERSTRGKAISGGLMNEDGALSYVVVVDTTDGLKQILLEPPRARGRWPPRRIDLSTDNFSSMLAIPHFKHYSV